MACGHARVTRKQESGETSIACTCECGHKWIEHAGGLESNPQPGRLLESYSTFSLLTPRDERTEDQAAALGFK